jgi:hypothetical protein
MPRLFLCNDMHKQALSPFPSHPYAFRVMKPRVIPRTLLSKIAAALTMILGVSAHAADWARLSPFTKVTCKPDSAVVEYQSREYDLVSVNDLGVAELLDLCRRKYRDNGDKRFSEDLVEVLALAGRPMGQEQTVKLVLKDRSTGASTTIERAPMTAANRDAVHRSLRTSAAEPVAKEDLPAALDLFEKTLREQWAYFKVGKGDFGAAINGLREKLKLRPMDSNTFAIELQKIVALGIDGHSGVIGYRLPDGFLPFLIEPSNQRLVAFSPDRGKLLDPAHPFITALDGKPMDEWLRAAAVLVPRGSPQYIRQHSLRMLRSVQFVRAELGLPLANELRVQLESADRRSKREVSLTIATKMPVFGIWPSKTSSMLPGQIGYLRITSMDEKAVEEIRTWMPRFRDAKALIVDVRGNGGGSRDALQALYSWLAAPGDRPKVVNAAVHPIAPAFREGHLESRFLYPELSPLWKPVEREAIATFKKAFRPEWQPPAGRFSDWHYFVLNHADAEGVSPFQGPVAVLMDEKCFSASDIFLAALKGLKNVQLVGTPSGGGSARAVTVRLTPTISVRLASMVSFQANGNLFDGRGVIPDVIAEPQPEYFIGGRDTVLETALAALAR